MDFRSLVSANIANRVNCLVSFGLLYTIINTYPKNRFTILMPGSRRGAVTILCATCLLGCTVWYITVDKGVVRCRTVQEIGHDIYMKYQF